MAQFRRIVALLMLVATFCALTAPLAAQGLETSPAEPDPSEPQHEESTPYVQILAYAALFLVPLAFIIIIARLQRKRYLASKQAARQHKEDARAAARKTP